MRFVRSTRCGESVSLSEEITLENFSVFQEVRLSKTGTGELSIPNRPSFSLSRGVSPSGSGGFIKSDQFTGGLRYELSETSNLNFVLNKFEFNYTSSSYIYLINSLFYGHPEFIYVINVIFVIVML